MTEKFTSIFDRNNFKEFVLEYYSRGGFTCSKRHKNFKSFNFISYSDLEENYTKINSLKDEKIPTLGYIYFTDQFGDINSEKSKIATNFYPYHICDIYECKICKTLFLVYDDTIAMYNTKRIREINPKLIIESPSMCVFKIYNENLQEFISDLNMTEIEFYEQIKKNNGLNKYRDYYIKMYRIIIKKISQTENENYILIITDRDKIYMLLEKYEKNYG